MTTNVSDTELQELKARVESLESQPRSIIVPLTTFAPEPYDVLQEIPVVIQGADEDFIASFFDADIHASGDTQEEAYANLKDILLAKYELFDNLPEERLGPGPKRQFDVLRQFVADERPPSPRTAAVDAPPGTD